MSSSIYKSIAYEYRDIFGGCLTNTDVCASLSTNLAEKEGLDNVTGLLREVQEEGGDPDPEADHHEEQAPCHSRCVP